MTADTPGSVSSWISCRSKMPSVSNLIRVAALVTFSFREVGDVPTIWFHARMADTRSGAIVAAVSAPLDSLGPTLGIRAASVADSFAAHLQQAPASPP